VSSATRAREKKAAIAIYYRAREEDKNRAEPLELTEFRKLFRGEDRLLVGSAWRMYREHHARFGPHAYKEPGDW
jgi:hypothetical protein